MLSAHELEQGAVELVRVADVEAVRGIIDDHELGAVDGLGGALAGDLEGHDRVGVAMDDEGGHGDALEVVAEVGAAEGVDAADQRLVARGTGDRQPLLALLLGHLQLLAGREEVGAEPVEEALAVLPSALLQSLGVLLAEAAVGVVVGLQQVRRHSAGEHGRPDPVLTVGADVAGDFTTTHREADQSDVAEIEAVEQAGQVRGEGVVVVAVLRLVRVAEAAPVVGDHAVAGLDQCRHLLGPRRAAQRPSVDEHHRPAVAAGVGVVEGDSVGVDLRHSAHPCS